MPKQADLPIRVSVRELPRRSYSGGKAIAFKRGSATRCLEIDGASLHHNIRVALARLHPENKRMGTLLNALSGLVAKVAADPAGTEAEIIAAESAIVHAARFALKFTPATTVLGKLCAEIDSLAKSVGQ